MNAAAYDEQMNYQEANIFSWWKIALRQTYQGLLEANPASSSIHSKKSSMAFLNSSELYNPQWPGCWKAIHIFIQQSYWSWLKATTSVPNIFGSRLKLISPKVVSFSRIFVSTLHHIFTMFPPYLNNPLSSGWSFSHSLMCRLASWLGLGSQVTNYN